MKDPYTSGTAPTEAQMEDFRSYAVNYLLIAPELATQCIDYAPDGNGFKMLIKEPLQASITPDQQEDLQLYFENL